MGITHLSGNGEPVNSHEASPCPHVQITPQMIEAGAKILRETVGDACFPFFSHSETAAEVYRAMAVLAPPLDVGMKVSE